MKFELYRDAKVKWRWRLIARNGRIAASSGEAFSSKTAARRAAANVREKAASADIVEPD